MYYVLYTYTTDGALECYSTYDDADSLYTEIDALQAQGIDTYYEEEYH